jgi:hypothetical protein
MGRAENNVTKQVRLAITQMGDRATFVRVQAGTFTIADRLIRGAEAGTADLIGVYRGIAVAMEIKTETGRQTATQREWAQRWEAAGGVYRVVRGYNDALWLFTELDTRLERRQGAD